MKVYIAGPMRGRPFFNFPTFFAAERYLEAAGYTPINPARHDTEQLGLSMYDFPHGDFDDAGWDRDRTMQFLRAALAWDLGQIALNADAIALLPGWETSTGVMKHELPLARTFGLHELHLSESQLSEAA